MNTMYKSYEFRRLKLVISHNRSSYSSQKMKGLEENVKN